jgi:hypothetical protein
VCGDRYVPDTPSIVGAGDPSISRRPSRRCPGRVSAVRHECAARPNAGSPAPSYESANGCRRAQSVDRCGGGSCSPPQPEAPAVPGDDDLVLDDDERRSPMRRVQEREGHDQAMRSPLEPAAAAWRDGGTGLGERLSMGAVSGIAGCRPASSRTARGTREPCCVGLFFGARALRTVNVSEIYTLQLA